MNGVHQIKWSAKDASVLAKKKDMRGGRIMSVKPGEHSKFTPHVVSRLDFAPERRTT
jgi:hypothetical protein